MTLDLFKEHRTNRELSLENAKAIEGLKLYFDFITSEEEKELLKNIDTNNWLTDLKRRVQHYGYKYDYKARRIDNSFFIGAIPDWMQFLGRKLNEKRIIAFTPDQAIVNEYMEDQGIAPHIDCEPCFGDTIISISLGASCVFNFEREPNSKDKVPLFLEPKTLVVMTGESRFNWYHGIPNRKSDEFNGSKLKRGRRVSITFRKVIV
jgi:alkylated DNA repair dioxygenase AlkB